MSVDPRKPFTKAELSELLGATLHGPLPQPTQYRLMASAAAAYELLGELLISGEPVSKADLIVRRMAMDEVRGLLGDL